MDLQIVDVYINEQDDEDLIELIILSDNWSIDLNKFSDEDDETLYQDTKRNGISYKRFIFQNFIKIQHNCLFIML